MPRFTEKPRKHFDEPHRKPSKLRLTVPVKKYVYSPLPSKLPSTSQREYVTEHGQKSPGLNPVKLHQRRELMEGMPKGAILELHAGKGNLSKEAYHDKASRHILIEKDSNELDEAFKKLNGKSRTPVEGYAMDNVKWAGGVMDPTAQPALLEES